MTASLPFKRSEDVRRTHPPPKTIHPNIENNAYAQFQECFSINCSNVLVVTIGNEMVTNQFKKGTVLESNC